MLHHIETPLTKEKLAPLRIGDQVLLTGEIFTGRDAAHKRMAALLRAGEALPISLLGQAIYYVGPCPPGPGQVIGSCGPTTSGRMDAYAPRLYEMGLMATIGKGPRSEEVIRAIQSVGGVYLAATGGAGALLASRVERAEVLVFPELGPEAIHRLWVRELPLVVAVDARGEDLYREGPERYRRDREA